MIALALDCCRQGCNLEQFLKSRHLSLHISKMGVTAVPSRPLWALNADVMFVNHSERWRGAYSHACSDYCLNRCTIGAVSQTGTHLIKSKSLKPQFSPLSNPGYSPDFLVDANTHLNNGRPQGWGRRQKRLVVWLSHCGLLRVKQNH